MPDVLRPTAQLALPVERLEIDPPQIDARLPTLVYTLYNLDPRWHEGEAYNRIFFIDTDLLERYPMAPKVLDFALRLAENVDGIQPFVGSFSDLRVHCGESVLHFREHPTQGHYEGCTEPRPMLTDTTGYFRSFLNSGACAASACWQRNASSWREAHCRHIRSMSAEYVPFC